jgi:hypothetical protein
MGTVGPFWPIRGLLWGKTTNRGDHFVLGLRHQIRRLMIMWHMLPKNQEQYIIYKYCKTMCIYVYIYTICILYIDVQMIIKYNLIHFCVCQHTSRIERWPVWTLLMLGSVTFLPVACGRLFLCFLATWPRQNPPLTSTPIKLSVHSRICS